MSIDNIRQFIKETAIEFGANPDVDFIERNNTKEDAFEKGGAYFGIISPEEDRSGPYHDFSIVIFPSQQINEPWLLALGIGSLGFKNDYDLASFPGLKRLFSMVIDKNGYVKSDFSDIENGLPKDFYGRDDISHLRKAIDNSKGYGKVLPAIKIIWDPESDESKKFIMAFLAIYAKIRNWDTKEKFKKAISKSLEPFLKTNDLNPSDEIEKLLTERKFLVLQGAPGTGKTRTAKEVAEKIKAKTFFTQFHAETTFSDFIYGIRPNIDKTELGYIENKGSFTNALQYSIDHPQEKTILIIDEINRANLSNVLGPVFYLFEHKMDKSNVEIEISPNFKISKLPENFFVIATMNTADRSLAVVDFALRRRFAWYSLKPVPINSKDFFKDDFSRIHEIFDWYASSNELSLQPGQGYFIASSEEEMLNRIKYEIFPLIKEYLQEGLVRNAKEELNNYFSKRINKSLFE